MRDRLDVSTSEVYRAAMELTPNRSYRHSARYGTDSQEEMGLVARLRFELRSPAPKASTQGCRSDSEVLREPDLAFCLTAVHPRFVHGALHHRAKVPVYAPFVRRLFPTKPIKISE
jgi:hypothetical protein